MWSRRHNISTFLLLAFGFVHCVNWTSCWIPPWTEHGKNVPCWLTKSWTRIRSNGKTLRMGEKQKLPWNMQSYVVNVSAVLLGQLVSFSFLGSIFLYFFHPPFFLCEWQREKGNVAMYSEISSFLTTAVVAGNGRVCSTLLWSTLSRAKWFHSWTRQWVWVPYSNLTFPFQLGFPLMLREWAYCQFSVVKGIFSIWWI